MPRIDRSVISRIYDTANIVDVVQDYVSLKRRGANYIGLCPFHNEKTGSFTVSPSKGIYKCFGCGEAGNAVSFVQKIEGCSFPDAIRKLAQRYHIEVVEEDMSDEERERENERATYFRLNEFALKWFEQQLWETDEGRSIGLSYFRGRQLRDDIIRRFRLGYAPNRNVFMQSAVHQGFSEEAVLKSGLCAKSSYTDEHGYESSGVFDRFRDRVVFPWFNMSGKVVAFNARLLREKKNAGKYVNSPEVEGLFEKRRELFGITLARMAIEKQGFCYLVEGQMDVISMVQAGVENVVASSGTALTREQVRLIKRLTQNVVVLYDADSAGEKATERGNEMFLKENMHVKMVIMPKGEDPDSLSHKMSAEEFRSFLENRQIDFIQYHVEKTKVAVEENPYEYGQMVHAVGDLISYIYDPISRRAYMKAASKRLDWPEDDMENYINKVISNRIKEEEKEREREKFREAYTQRKNEAQTAQSDSQSSVNQPNDAAGRSVNAETAPMTSVEPETKRAKVERSIVSILVKYGKKPCFTYDDGTVETIAGYISRCLEGDNISLSVSSYRQVYEEYMQHCDEPDFDAERYFASHPDPQVVSAVSGFIIERYQLSRMFDRRNVSENITRVESQPDEATEAAAALPKIMLQLKIAVIDEMIEKLQRDIENSKSGDASDESTAYIAKQMNLQHLRRQIMDAVRKM